MYIQKDDHILKIKDKKLDPINEDDRKKDAKRDKYMLSRCHKAKPLKK